MCRSSSTTCLTCHSERHIRDSYSNCLGGFLAESYGEVVLVDLRYYRQAVSALALEEDFDDILVCYNCTNFLTDTNLPLLR